MSTKVFISWSGGTSQKIGEALRNWLPAALQFVKPYFSPEDIEKGAKWNAEISAELDSSNIGIICLTGDNTEKPWILFEAGALSKSLDKSRVCTLLVGIEPADVKGPLTSFQATKFVKEDFKRLFVAINNAAGDARLDSQVLESVFEMWWPRLQEDVDKILKSTDAGAKKELRSERDILEELLELSRLNSSRAARPRVSGGAMRDLLAAKEELEYALRNERFDFGLHLLRRMDGPLKYLCDEAGIPFSRYSMKSRKGPRSLLEASRDVVDTSEVEASIKDEDIPN